ncbi:MAG: response regulator [Bryobacteraceae bacterium]
MNIMVVDDEADVRLLYEQRFRKEVRSGQVVLHFALSAEEALAFLEKDDGDMLILSDINMPGMSGLDLLREVKSKRRDRKVFMVTAYGNEEYQRKAQAYGCDDYLTKPIDFGALKAKLLS